MKADDWLFGSTFAHAYLQLKSQKANFSFIYSTFGAK